MNRSTRFVVAGINPGSKGFFIPNAIVPVAQASQGIDEFIITATVDFFEGYGLGGDDRWVIESDIRSIFASGDGGSDVLSVKSDASGGTIALLGGAGYDEITVVAPQWNHVTVDGGQDNDSIYLFIDQDSPILARGYDFPVIVSSNDHLSTPLELYWSHDRVVVSKKSSFDLADAYTWYEMEDDGWQDRLVERFNRDFDSMVELEPQITVSIFGATFRWEKLRRR